MDGIEVLIILFFVLISILDAMGRSRRKRQGTQGRTGAQGRPGQQPRRKDGEAADYELTDRPPRGVPIEAERARVEPAARSEEPDTSEGLIPKDIWEEIAGLVLEGQQGRGGARPGQASGPERPGSGPGGGDAEVSPYDRSGPERAALPDWQDWTLEEPPPRTTERAGLSEKVEEEWRDETRRARFPVPPSGGAGPPAPRPRWEVPARREGRALAPSAAGSLAERREALPSVRGASVEAPVTGEATEAPAGGRPFWPDSRRLLRSRDPAALRQAFILKEVLGPPRALREYGE